MPKGHWLVKSEPDVYAFSDLERDGKTAWTDVRNYQARNHMRAMQVGDEVLYYHTGDEKAVVGLARVIRQAYPETTKDEGDWSVVDLEPVRAFKARVTLAQIKAHATLKDMVLAKSPRLSVQPVTEEELAAILKLAK